MTTDVGVDVGNSLSSLVGMQTGATTMEIITEFPQVLEIDIS